MRYRYTHTATEATTGYFACKPAEQLSLARAMALLAECPFDDFLRRDLLERLAGLAEETIDQALQDRELAQNPAVQALLHESTLLRSLAQKDETAWQTQPGTEGLAAHSSLVYLRWRQVPGRERQRPWLDFFTANQREHHLLKAPEQTGLPPLYEEPTCGATPAAVFTAPFAVSLQELHAKYLRDSQPCEPLPTAAETAALAEERLTRLGIIAGQEMRHTASLSPVALLRPWNIRLSVNEGRNRHTLEGEATTYGRGLCLENARVSCLMEMVERASAYLSIENGQVLNRKGEAPLRKATLAELRAEGFAAIDPNDYPIEAPYVDEKLHWIQGYSFTDSGERLPVFAPVQMAGLFCNLDEIALYDAPGSTGIATGPTMEWAMRTALLEIIERDAEAVTPYHKSRCFTLCVDQTKEPLLHALLADYARRGINVQFQDMTGELGVPVFKCFVLSRKGSVAAGFGAGLSARAALISALTETPYPYPEGGPSGPLLRKLPVRKLEDEPDYTLGTVSAEFHMLDALFRANGRTPVYINLTRADLQFPVVRCLVPGMELAADRDAFSRIPPRLYKAYLRLSAPLV